MHNSSNGFRSEHCAENGEMLTLSLVTIRAVCKRDLPCWKWKFYTWNLDFRKISTHSLDSFFVDVLKSLRLAYRAYFLGAKLAQYGGWGTNSNFDSWILACVDIFTVSAVTDNFYLRSASTILWFFFIISGVVTSTRGSDRDSSLVFVQPFPKFRNPSFNHWMWWRKVF